MQCFSERGLSFDSSASLSTSWIRLSSFWCWRYLLYSMSSPLQPCEEQLQHFFTGAILRGLVDSSRETVPHKQDGGVSSRVHVSPTQFQARQILICHCSGHHQPVSMTHLQKNNRYSTQNNGQGASTRSRYLGERTRPVSSMCEVTFVRSFSTYVSHVSLTGM